MANCALTFYRDDGEWKFVGDCDLNGNVFAGQGDYEIEFKRGDGQDWKFHKTYVLFKDMRKRKPGWTTAAGKPGLKIRL